MNLGESFIQTNDPSLKLFQCAVCNKFTTDTLDLLGLHMNVERSLPEEEWKAVMGDSYQCKLCRYNTQLKANFQLHCKTDKHVQKYQLVAHIKEGGKANEWRLKCVAIGNPVHLKCNACDYYTNSLEKLRLHTVNSRHEASLKLYKVSPGLSLEGAEQIPWVTRRLGADGHFVPLTGGTGIERGAGDVVEGFSWELKDLSAGCLIWGPGCIYSSPILCIVPPTFLRTDFFPNSPLPFP